MFTNNKQNLMVVYLLSGGSICLVCLVLFSSFTPARSSPSAALSQPYASHTPTYAPGTPTPTDIWPALWQRTPFAYTTPLPPATPSKLDGSYAKLDASEAQWWQCRRCADYRPAGGIWKLSFDRGVFRIYYAVTGWRSLGSYQVEADRLYLFNDPSCPWETGIYTWRLEAGQLLLEEVEDTCSIHLRAENLTRQPWLSCQPPSIMAAISDYWPKPKGCRR